MIKQKKRGLLIVISAPSGSGKGTIMKQLLQNDRNRWLSISTTSREIRNDDIPGVTYNFVSKNEFIQKISEDYFLEYAMYAGNYYGTPKETIEDKLNNGIDVFLEIEIEGAKNIKKIYPEAVLIFILPPSMTELIDRLRKRATDSEEKILKRLMRSYEEILELNNYDYVVVNDELDNSIKQIEGIMTAEKSRTNRVEEIIFDIEKDNLEDYLGGKGE